MKRYYEPEEVYGNIRETSVKQIREEYSAMRDIAQKRLGRLKAAGLEGTQLYRDWVNRFPMLREIGKTDTRYLAESLVEVSRFLAMKTSTLSGMKSAVASSRETFEKHYGPEFGKMSAKEYQLFRETMASIKSSGAAYYRQWKKSFRKVLDKTRSGKVDINNLLDKIKNKDAVIGPKGGIYDARTKKSIEKTWSEMGNP